MRKWSTIWKKNSVKLGKSGVEFRAWMNENIKFEVDSLYIDGLNWADLAIEENSVARRKRKRRKDASLMELGNSVKLGKELAGRPRPPSLNRPNQQHSACDSITSAARNSLLRSSMGPTFSTANRFRSCAAKMSISIDPNLFFNLIHPLLDSCKRWSISL